MVGTRKKMAEEAFKHLMAIVIKRNENSSIWNGCIATGILTLADLVNFEETELTEVHYIGDDDNEYGLANRDAKTLRKVYCWGKILATTNPGLTEQNSAILAMDPEEFQGWTYHPAIVTPSTTSPTSITGIGDTSSDSAAEFRKGNKRNLKDFKEFSEVKKYTIWKRSVEAVTRAYGLSHVLDATHVPVDPVLFQAQQDYMYTVFDTVVKTVVG